MSNLLSNVLDLEKDHLDIVANQGATADTKTTSQDQAPAHPTSSPSIISSKIPSFSQKVLDSTLDPEATAFQPWRNTALCVRNACEYQSPGGYKPTDPNWLPKYFRDERRIALRRDVEALGITDEDLEQASGFLEGDIENLEGAGAYEAPWQAAVKEEPELQRFTIPEELSWVQDGAPRVTPAYNQMSKVLLAVKVNNILMAFRELPVPSSASYALDICRAVAIISEDQFDTTAGTRAVLTKGGFFFKNAKKVGLPDAVFRWLEGEKDGREMMDYNISMIDAAVPVVKGIIEEFATETV